MRHTGILLNTPDRTPLCDSLSPKQQPRRRDRPRRNPAAPGGAGGASAFTIWVLSDRTTPLATFRSCRAECAESTRAIPAAWLALSDVQVWRDPGPAPRRS
jgi:hypothetical protein